MPKVLLYWLRCGSCDFQCKDRGSLKRHLLIHADPSKVKTFKCSHCSYESLFKRYLHDHMQKHREPSQIETFDCEHCDFRTNYKLSLRRHAHIHKDPSQITLFKCNECNYQASRKCLLRVHMLVSCLFINSGFGDSKICPKISNKLDELFARYPFEWRQIFFESVLFGSDHVI